MIKLLLFLSIMVSTPLFAYSDMDMDGVDDQDDHCPHTPFSTLVNTQGCAVKSLTSEHHFDLILGGGYSQLNYASNQQADTLTTTLQADYYTQKFSAQIVASSYTSSDERGLNDTVIAAFYQIPLSSELSLRVGGGVILPTYKTGYSNEEADYMGSLDVTYLITPKTALSSGYSHTIVNDQNVPNVLLYQDTDGYYASILYFMDQQLSLGTSYTRSDTIYRDVEPIKKISAYGTIRFDSHWFVNGIYSYGLSDSTSDYTVDFRLGYYF